MDSQEIALRLREFWEAEGCPAIPTYGSIPAGGLTFDVFFGILAPDPWCACQVVSIVDPSVALYDDDPLRPIIDSCLQVTRQDPSGDLRKRFIESLRVLEIDPRDRDVRFVAHGYDLSHLAARAAGWRVLIDGIEVGSLFYVRQLGGIDLKFAPIVVEYFLRRMEFAVGIEGEKMPTERGRQIASYVLEHANPERIGSFLSLHADECEQALGGGLYYQAYDHVLASVYLLSVLTARDGLSAKEYATRTARIADLARGCARAYVEATDA